jgi:hypothetical protein
VTAPRDTTAEAAGRGQRGQSLVEFSLLVPLFMMILFGMIEFGVAFTHELTIEYAVREGARAGAALSNGGGNLGCSAGQSVNWKTVDPLVIAAVERVLQSPGSQIVVARVSKIVIYKANPVTGADDQGLHNTWLYSAAGGPMPQGTTDKLNFADASYPDGDAWRACTRNNASPNIDSIGVSIVYTYAFETPLASILGFFGGGTPSLTVTDKTVMDLNPPTS